MNSQIKWIPKKKYNLGKRRSTSRQRRQFRNKFQKAHEQSVFNVETVHWKTVNMAANYWAQSQAKMLDLQHNHELAYWKSKAEALNYENKILHSIIENIYLHGSKSKHTKRANYLRPKMDLNQGSDGTSSEEEEIESEIDEGYLSFLKVSMKHQADKQKIKDEMDKKTYIPPPTIAVGVKRSEEMKLLYGKSSALISGLETRVQLDYDRFMDRNKPLYWPNIPLNI